MRRRSTGQEDRRRRLRVVTLVDRISVTGGGERVAQEVAMRLDPDRFDRIVCASRRSSGKHADLGRQKVRDELDAAGVRFVNVSRETKFDVLAWRKLLALLRRERIDVLHAHKFGSNVWAAILGTLARTPVVVAHEHTWSFEGQPLRRLLDRRLIAPRVDAFLTVSRADRSRMIEVEGVDPRKLVYVPNGIPTPPPARRGHDIRAELGIPSEARLIGSVCVLRPQKAVEVLIDAAKILTSRLPGVRVLIAGEGPERPALERRIDELGMAGTVILLGRRDDVPDILAALDLAVCCSDFEGMPLSVLEYMEAGLPIVATAVGGVPDLIISGESGLLVERKDPAGLADAALRLLEDPVSAAAMGKRAHARRRSHFHVDVMVETIEQIYEQLAAGLPSHELRLSSEAEDARPS